MVVSLLSCRPTVNNPSIPITKIKFIADGQQYEWEGSLAEVGNTGSIIKKKNPGWGSWFALEGVLNEKTIISIPLSPDANINIGLVFTPNNWGEPYLFLNPCIFEHSGSNMTIEIKKVENGFVSGTFEGWLNKISSQSSCPSKAVISNGEFTNVKILR